jgi:cholesterol transport system auxiliary component
MMACGAGSVPQSRFYRLHPGSGSTSTAPAQLPGVLVVERFGADGLVGERPILYTNGSTLELRQHHYDYWVQPPPDMLQEQMTAYLSARKIASVVATPDMRLPPDFVLRGRLSRFERVLGAGNDHIVIEARMSLADTRASRLVLVRTYRAEVPVSDPGVAASVDAFNRGTEQLLGQLVIDLAER